MLTNGLHPWLESNWSQIQSMAQQSRLPHALMLLAADGLAIDEFARSIATSLLCQTPSSGGFACGNCPDCKLLLAATHPDLHIISVPEDKKQISVDQIRALVKICLQRPHQGGYRIALIDPCAAMNIAAANALLKTLEEPGDNTLLILVANTSNHLPATIRSRCQLIPVYPPTEEKGIEWLMQQGAGDKNTSLLALRLAGHAPVKALSLISSGQLQIRQKLLAAMDRASKGLLDPVKLVADINKNDISLIIDWMYSLALDGLKVSQHVSDKDIVNSDQPGLLKSFSSIKPARLIPWIDRLIEARRLLATSSNINPQLLVEDLMFRWIAIFR